MQLSLPDMTSSARLGRNLAKALAATGRSHLVLLQGDLGAGKTTLVRFLVEALPGGDAAEVASPSFTLCNIYPTRPEVWHYDLYRLEEPQPGLSQDESLLEALEYFEDGRSSPLAHERDNRVLMLVEWPERLDPKFLPPSYLLCRLTAEQNDRRASFESYGQAARESLKVLAALMSEK